MGESRGTGIHLPIAQIGIPARVFLFTVDQIATMLDVKEETVLRSYLYFEGRSIGTRRKDLMIARTIAPADDKPEWRITEREFVRWMRTKGFRFYERGGFAS